MLEKRFEAPRLDEKEKLFFAAEVIIQFNAGARRFLEPESYSEQMLDRARVQGVCFWGDPKWGEVTV